MFTSAVNTSAQDANDRCTVFGNRLKELRLSRCLSQADLAEQIHLSATTVNRYEHGLREPSLEILAVIATFFGVDFNYLLCKPEELTLRDESDLVLIHKFHTLDDRGKSTVLSTLEHEYTTIVAK